MRQELPDGTTVEVSGQVMDDPLEQMLRSVEADFEAIGWDVPAMLFHLVLDKSAGALGLAPLKWMPDDVLNDPGPNLIGFATWLRSDSAKPLVGVLHHVIPDHFYGLVLVCEGWMIPVDNAQANRITVDGYISDELRPSSHPDRVEGRLVTAVCVDGQMAQLTRIRGEVPEYRDILTIEDLELVGRVPDALRLLCELFREVAVRDN